jgi:hypothetical protein
MKRLSESEFRATFAEPMRSVSLEAEPPVDFWGYVDTIPEEDFAGHDCSEGKVGHVWDDATGRFQHILIQSEDRNVFMVIVVELREGTVFGHRLLDLNREYGLQVP